MSALLLSLAAATLTPDGWGRLRIGMTRAQGAAAMGGPARGRVTGAEPARCEEFHPVRAPAGLIVMIEDGRLSRIAATRRGLRTAGGIAVGDPEVAVMRRHMTRLDRKDHAYADPPAADLTWSRDARRGITYEIGTDRRVQSIRVGGPATRYVEGCL